MISSGPRKALIVDDEESYRRELKNLLLDQGYQVVEAENGQQAVELFQQENPSIVFMDVVMPVLDGYQATRRIKAFTGNRFVPVIFVTASNTEATMNHCIEAGGDDFLAKPYDTTVLQSKIRSLQRIAALNREVQGMYSMIHREQEVAEAVFVGAIQRSNIENPWLRHVVRPARIFSGDMVLSAYSPTRDLYFLVGDFTGHGLLASLGAMPVSEVFRAMTARGFGAGDILCEINSKLKAILPTGMFFGALLLVVNHDLQHVRVFNAGMPDLLIVDGASHRIKYRLHSTGLPLGVESSYDPDALRQYAPLAQQDKILMYSDGLIEARDGKDREFGADRLLEAIDSAPPGRLFDHLFTALDAFCGEREQNDDVTLAEISCVSELLPPLQVPEALDAVAQRHGGEGDWKIALRFDAERLRETNPVPILVNYLLEMETLQNERQALFTVLTELYLNALDHGVLGMDSSRKGDPDGFEAYFQTRRRRLARLDSGYLQFDLAAQHSGARRLITVRVEDSGEGFDFRQPALFDPESRSGLALVRSLCESLEFSGRGNIATARFSWVNDRIRKSG